MLESMTMCVNHARRVQGIRTIHFKTGINVIAGPNGSGKSTILRAIHSCGVCEKQHTGPTTFHFFDTQTMNPRTAEGPAENMTNMILRIRSIFSSHGQIMKSALTALPVKEGDCLLIDEPEAGQDLQGIQHIREGFQAVADRGGQVIIASHHPAFWNDVHVIELGKGYIEQVRAECRRIVDA